MKVFLSFLLWAMMMPVWAQQPPIYPPGPNHAGTPYDLRNQDPRNPQWDERERHRQWREAQRMRRFCDEQRERVARHPRLMLPRECWRR